MGSHWNRPYNEKGRPLFRSGARADMGQKKSTWPDYVEYVKKDSAKKSSYGEDQGGVPIDFREGLER